MTEKVLVVDLARASALSKLCNYDKLTVCTGSSATRSDTLH